MLNTFKHQGMPIGLDLSDVSLRVVQLGYGRGDAKEIQAFGEVPIPKDAFLDREFKQPEVLISTLKQALKNPEHGRVTTDEVVSAIPETKAFVRVIEMPALSAREAEEAVPWEAEQYVPLPIGQVYLDWVILGSPEAQENSKMKVLLTAAPRDYVDQFVSVLKQAGLRVAALEVESQAAARALVSSTDLESVVLIADMGTHHRTSFTILNRGILHFTSSMPVAGNALTQAVMRAKGVKKEEAEKLKQKHGLSEENKDMRKALTPVIDQVAHEVINTIRFYEEHADNEGKVERLILTGGSSRLEHLPSYLSERLKRAGKSADFTLRSISGLKVELGNPWTNVLGKGQTPPLSRQESQSFATSIGLALRPLEEE